MNIPAIKTENLRKVFTPFVLRKKTVALDGLSLTMPQGKIYGCLGPNGAGKTTTLKVLLSLLEPTEGKAFLFGEEVGCPSLRNRVGYMAENPRYYSYLSAFEFLNYTAKFFKMGRRDRKKRINELIDYVGLGGSASKKLKGFSRGMLQRLGLAQAMINAPDLLLLDEPMSGLDPIGRNEFKTLIKSISKDEGKSVLICSHVLIEIEQICDYVGIISKGKLLVEDELSNLLNLKRYKIRVDRPGDVFVDSLITEGVEVLDREDGKVLLSAEGHEQTENVKQLADQNGVCYEEVSVENETLEDYFIRIVTADHSEGNI